MGKIAGRKIVLQVDTKTLVGYRSHSMDVTADMADATTGESTNQWKEQEPMYKGMEFSVEGLYDPTSGDNLSLDDVYDLLAAGTQVTAKYGNTEAGSKYYQVSAYVTSISESAPHDDLASYTVNLVADGEPTTGTVGA
ncbi:MAG: phage tail tube protein [candidate division WOR-3 bacterium]|nr:phage tail tube protein [candidate division WOR-3 bacterium]